MEDDEDWSPRSIYDGEDDEEPRGASVAAKTRAGRRIEDARIHAQIAGASIMAEADAALARLDEKLSAGGFTEGLVERIATAEAEALGRLIGWRGRDGDSALRFRYEAALEDEDDAWTRWAGRTLAAPFIDIVATTDADALADRLRTSGWRRMDALEAADAIDDGAPVASPDRGERDQLVDWLATIRPFGDFGPTARGAMSFHAWQTGGAGGLTERLTGAIASMRFGAGASLRTLRFTPAAAAARRLRPFDVGLDAAERLTRWCCAVTESCRTYAALVDDLMAWRATAFDAERTRTGRGIVDLLLRKPQAMSEDVAKDLGVTVQGANHRLRAMCAAGLVASVDESRRFRRWKPQMLREGRGVLPIGQQEARDERPGAQHQAAGHVSGRARRAAGHGG